MPDQLGKELLKIIKTFSPKDRELLPAQGAILVCSEK
jgi:hypothetical protein